MEKALFVLTWSLGLGLTFVFQSCLFIAETEAPTDLCSPQAAGYISSAFNSIFH